MAYGMEWYILVTGVACDGVVWYGVDLCGHCDGLVRYCLV